MLEECGEGGEEGLVGYQVTPMHPFSCPVTMQEEFGDGSSQERAVAGTDSCSGE